MRKIIIGLLLLLSVGATAQWQQTGSKVRYVNGLGIPTKDTAAGVAADSSQILIRPADSSLYVKYKRTWLRVGGGGGSIAGSGTTNYLSKFTSSTAIGNSQIFDNGTNVGIGTTSPSTLLSLAGATSTTFGLSISPSGWNNAKHRVAVPITGDESMFSFNWNGSAKDYASYDYSHIYVGNGTLKFGTNGVEAFRVSSGARTLIGTTTDNGVDKLQVSGNIRSSQNIYANTFQSSGDATFGGNLGAANVTSNNSIFTLGITYRYIAKTATYTLIYNDYLVDCTSGTFTINLPSANGFGGKVFVVKNSGAGTITVDGNGAETIDGAATYTLSVQYATIQIMSDNTNWKIIAKF